MAESDDRKQAIRRIKGKRAFQQHLAVYVIINIFLWVIWAASGAGFPWPVFVTFGWGIGLVSNAWAVYGAARPITDADIEKEMQKGTDTT